MHFGKPHWKDFYRGTEREWIITNGMGSFASSTIIGANTRRYHGLLIASLNAPTNRYLIISKLDECLTLGDKKYFLHSNQTPNYIGEGYKYQHSADLELLPTFTYCVEGVYIVKKISMFYEKNTVAVMYTIRNGAKPASIEIYPLINFRDYHGNSSCSDLSFNVISSENGFAAVPNGSNVNIELKISEGSFEQQSAWFYNMFYQIENERGLHSTEDHYIPGLFKVQLDPYEKKTFTIVGSIDGIETLDGQALIEKEEKRLKNLLKQSGSNDEFANTLVLSADKFIVQRQSTKAKTIIAGYPWFSDWGRDTMIALPGLTLLTKRYDDAEEILNSFTEYIKNGLIPNMFPDAGQEPIYNTVDASLWFFEAVFKFLEHTNKHHYIKQKIYPKLKVIIESYMNGTEFNIKMDSDGLIYSGRQDLQLTWMDAKVGDWVVTPRQGKAVEINALWYNALRIIDSLAKHYGDDSTIYYKLAEKVKKSFEKFWNKESNCLYDVINNNFRDDKIRPNQIIAVSLSYPVIEGDTAKRVVNKVYEELFAAFGLRSLSKNDAQYRGIYLGDQYSRDGAYHQGTVWSWLIGSFIGAYLKINNYSKESKTFCLELLKPFRSHLNDAGIGSVSEIFDGDDPNLPRGCFAQAWGVAELLRAYLAAKGKIKY